MRELKARQFNAYSRMNYGYYTRCETGNFINLINAGVYIGPALVVAWRFGCMALVSSLVLLSLSRWQTAAEHRHLAKQLIQILHAF